MSPCTTLVTIHEEPTSSSKTAAVESDSEEICRHRPAVILQDYDVEEEDFTVNVEDNYDDGQFQSEELSLEEGKPTSTATVKEIGEPTKTLKKFGSITLTHVQEDKSPKLENFEPRRCCLKPKNSSLYLPLSIFSCFTTIKMAPELNDSLNSDKGKSAAAAAVAAAAERKISASPSVKLQLEPEAIIRERKISNISNIHHPHHDEIEKRVNEQLHNEHHGNHNLEKKAGVKIRKSTQFLSAIAANMGAFSLGTVMAWSATALPSLRSSGDLGEISKSEESWIGSIVTLAAVVSCPAAAYSMVTFGRRRSMLLLTGPFILGWICIAFAEMIPSFLPNIFTIYFGRILTGFCGGAFSVLAPIFVAESAHEKLRGALASLFDLMLSVGMLFIYVIGAYTSWKVQALACGVIPIVCHCLLLLVSESPRFLVEQGQITAASQALAWLYGLKAESLTLEMAMLAKSVEESQAKPVNFDRVILKMSVLKPIIICATVMFFYTMCVYDAVIFYTVDIFKSTGTSLDPKDSAMILGLVQVIATIPAAVIVDKLGRRLLLLVSEFLLAGSLFAMGLFFFLVEADTEEDKTLHLQYGWLPLTALNIFLIGYSIGLGPLSMLLIGEIVPSHIKGMTTCFALMIRWSLGFGVTNLFETLESSIGPDKTYWLFAIICACGLVFIYFCIPETKGKSLDDIQTGFIHKSKLKAMQLQLQNNNMMIGKGLNNKEQVLVDSALAQSAIMNHQYHHHPLQLTNSNTIKHTTETEK